MKTATSLCVAVVLGLSAKVFALSQSFEFDQVFSSADGTVQYLEVIDRSLHDCDAFEEVWAGQKLRSFGPAGKKEFIFQSNLPTCRTTKKHILIATQRFADLHIVQPDFVIPNGFLQLPSGSVELDKLGNTTGIAWSAMPTDGMTALDPDGKPIPAVATNLAGASGSVLVVTAPAIETVVEYYNAALDHYFISWIAAEIAILDEGVKIKGWSRTGSTFRTYTGTQASASPVCRFYIPPALGDSHFFGRGTAECNATATKFPDLLLEDPAFMHLALPSGGVCPAGTINVYRVFSNRADANHRYMTDPAVRDAMKARGWTPEGDGPDMVVMCAPAL